jgi:hypothetical protein
MILPESLHPLLHSILCPQNSAPLHLSRSYGLIVRAYLREARLIHTKEYHTLRYFPRIWVFHNRRFARTKDIERHDVWTGAHSFPSF